MKKVKKRRKRVRNYDGEPGRNKRKTKWERKRDR